MQISFSKRKVHYLYLILAIVSLLLALVSYARAETTEPATSRQTVEARMEDKQAAREERRSTMTTELQNRFINLVRNVFERMDAAITRLENVATRLETRTTKLATLGIDTGPALIPLSEAKRKLAEARRMLGEAKSEAESGLVSDTPRERFAATRAEFTLIREEIRSSFILLRESLTELKDAVMEEELNRGVSSAVVNTEPIVAPE